MNTMYLYCKPSPFVPDDEQRYVRYWRTESIQGRQLLKMQQPAAAAHNDESGHSSLHAGMLLLGFRTQNASLVLIGCQLCLPALTKTTYWDGFSTT